MNLSDWPYLSQFKDRASGLENSMQTANIPEKLQNRHIIILKHRYDLVNSF